MKNGQKNVQKNKINILLTLFLFCVLIHLFFMPKTPYQIDLPENINPVPISSEINPNINLKENNLKEKEKQANINENNDKDEEEILYHKYQELPFFEENKENIVNTNNENSKDNDNIIENEVIKINSKRRIFFPNFEKISIFCFFGIIFYLMYSNYQKNELNKNKNEKKNNEKDGYCLLDNEDKYYENI